MKMKVIGKEQMRGTSKKTGKAYDASNVHVEYKSPRVAGMAVERLWVDASLVWYDEIVVGGTYDVERDSNGYLLCFEKVNDGK